MPRRRSSSHHRSRSRSLSNGHKRNKHRSPELPRRNRSRSREHNSNDDIERLNPTPSKVLGVFGLSSRTDERTVRRLFSTYGRINSIHIVYDRGTGRSRGFGFIYYDKLEDAREAKRGTHGIEVEGQKIRVDFSLTDRPHERTPGIYMGAPTYQRYRNDRRPTHRSRSHRSRSRS